MVCDVEKKELQEIVDSLRGEIIMLRNGKDKTGEQQDEAGRSGFLI